MQFLSKYCLIQEQKLRATQEDQRRKLEDLRLLEIQDALKQRDDEAAKIEKEFEAEYQRWDSFSKYSTD